MTFIRRTFLTLAFLGFSTFAQAVTLDELKNQIPEGLMIEIFAGRDQSVSWYTGGARSEREDLSESYSTVQLYQVLCDISTLQWNVVPQSGLIATCIKK
ncbi:MAG: hypothetical protein AB7T49_01840 [Oligoflexales bacterium]